MTQLGDEWAGVVIDGRLVASRAPQSNVAGPELACATRAAWC